MEPRKIRRRRAAVATIIRPGETFGVGFPVATTRVRYESTLSKPPKPLLDQDMNPMERFFAALLLSPATDFSASKASESRALHLWETICDRVGLTIPKVSLRPIYPTKESHFAVRAALVLEEARTAISQSLNDTWACRHNDRKQAWKAAVTKSYKTKDTQSFKVSFHLDNFSQEKLFHIRPGGVLLCVPHECNNGSLEDFLLGVVTTSNRNEVENSGVFTCMFFRESDFSPFLESSNWILSPVCRLITELRAFEAMTVRPGEVEFLPELLGKQRGTSLTNERKSDNSTVRLSSSTNQAQNVETESDSSCKDDWVGYVVQNNTDIFNVPTLNRTQEIAATSFLNSEIGTVSLVQGPPGTGKHRRQFRWKCGIVFAHFFIISTRHFTNRENYIIGLSNLPISYGNKKVQ
jgi:hypothetical protein